MAIELKDRPEGNVVQVRLTGKLAAEDYKQFTPQLEQRIEEHGKVRLVVELHDFHGWSAGALWEDLKFDVKHFNDIEKLAIVGETRWEKGMASFCKPFTTAEIRFFELARADEARQWIAE